MHVGVHDAPCASVEVQSFRAPLATAVDASQELPLHTAVSVRIPAAHDLVPDRVYPVLHVGAHVEPLARVFGQGDALPKLMGSAASLHGSAERLAVSVIAPSLHDRDPDMV